MAKIRHIALATQDPDKTAAFFKDGFGFEEVQRFGDFTGNTPGKSYGMYLSDGTLCLAIIKFGWSQAGKSLDFVGIHHFGVQVENLEEYTARLEQHGAEFLNKRPPGAEATFYEAKFLTPDKVLMDIAEEPWSGSEPI
jgi:catechol 2,3-dioxygenase-like lactoylglutathione lyase family enzyme